MSVVAVTASTFLFLHLTSLRMSNYAKVERKIWCKRWSTDEKVLAIYFLTNKHGNAEGYYYLPMAYICEDLGWPLERAFEALSNLIERGFVMYDEDTCVVFIPKALRYNLPANENQEKGAVRQILEVPESPLLRDFLTVVEGLSKPLASRFEGALNSLTLTQPLTQPPTQEERPTEEDATKEEEGEEKKVAKERKVFSKDSDEYRLALLLRNLLTANPAYKGIELPDGTPEALSKWSLDVDRLHRLDGKPYADIEALIEWCQKDDFWNTTIQSTSGLRKHWNKMWAQRNGRKRTSGSAARPKTLDDQYQPYDPDEEEE